MLSYNWKPGYCKLCNTYTPHLERHHLSYKPEVTIDLCHSCHFLCHFYPNRLLHYYKEKMLCMLYPRDKALSLLQLYENNPVMLAKLFAPSRRENIRKAQLEELNRIKAEKEQK